MIKYVRQGGLFSPCLFSVYIDYLSNLLRNSCTGCCTYVTQCMQVIWPLSPAIWVAVREIYMSHSIKFNHRKTMENVCPLSNVSPGTSTR